MQQNPELTYWKDNTAKYYERLETLVQSGQDTSILAKTVREHSSQCISYFEQEILSMSAEISQHPIIRLHKHPPSADPTQLVRYQEVFIQKIINAQNYLNQPGMAYRLVEKQNALQGIINNFLTLHSSLCLLINQYSNQQSLKQEQRFAVKLDSFPKQQVLEPIQQELHSDQLFTFSQENNIFRQPPLLNSIQLRQTDTRQFDNPSADFPNQQKQIPQQKEQRNGIDIHNKSKKIKKQIVRKPSKPKVMENSISYGQLKYFKYEELLYGAIANEENRKCYLCHRPADRNLGKMVALPYNQEIIACHDSCALWITDLYLKEDENTYQQEHLDQLLNYSKNQKCSICNKLNASLKCNEKFCSKYYHFPCFMENEEEGGVIDTFQVICSNHYNGKYLQQIERYRKQLKNDAKNNLQKTKDQARQNTEDLSNCEQQQKILNDKENLPKNPIQLQSSVKFNHLSQLVQQIANFKSQNQAENLDSSNNKNNRPIIIEKQQNTVNQTSAQIGNSTYLQQNPITILNNPIAKIIQRNQEVPQHKSEESNILRQDHEALQRRLKNNLQFNSNQEKFIKIEDS